jgi:hypothetical protein
MIQTRIRVCVSFSKWFYELYLAQIQGNRSGYIEEMVAKGINLTMQEIEKPGQITQSAIIKIANLQDELKKATETINRLKKILKKKSLMKKMDYYYFLTQVHQDSACDCLDEDHKQLEACNRLGAAEKELEKLEDEEL